MAQDPGVTPVAPPPRSHAGGFARVRAWLSRYETPLWIAVVLVLVVVRWPVIKGYYYKFTEAEAPANAIEWRTDLDSALAESRRLGRRVVVDFTADWCPPCIAMQHDVWPSPDVARVVAEGYVPVLIDTDINGEVPARYGVEGIPTVLILDSAGAVLRTGAPLTASGMVSFLSAPE